MPWFRNEASRSSRKPSPLPRFRGQPRTGRLQRLFAGALCLLILTGILADFTGMLPTAQAATLPNVTPATLSLDKFLTQPRTDKTYRGPLIRSPKPDAIPDGDAKHKTDYAHLPPSSQPATMQPLTQDVADALNDPKEGGNAVVLQGSDKRVEVVIPAGSLDIATATVQAPAGSGPNAKVAPIAPSGKLSFKLIQHSGHAVGETNVLGSYELQIVDGNGHQLTGVHLRRKLRIVYHYQPDELKGLDLNPDHLILSWPTLIAEAQKTKKPTTDYVASLVNDPKAHTLTAETSAPTVAPFVLNGTPDNQSPPTPHLASVGGNSGQLGYGYPLLVPPGPAGFTPQLQLGYSSSGPNERHSRTSSAGGVGDGWSLSLGSISMERYDTGASPNDWYFLSGIANVGDRLIQQGTTAFYQTEHISHLRIEKTTDTHPCFHVWDKAGTYYELGCTTDSLQYYTNSNGRTDYRYDVNKIIAPNQGSGTNYKTINVIYMQDINASSVRDAALMQIKYGYGTSTGAIQNVVGIIDFSYRAPFNNGRWASAYDATYRGGCTGISISTTLRCDDPVKGTNTLDVPQVMSTLSLSNIVSYVGSSDTTNTALAYAYDFSYQDSFSASCNEPYSLSTQSCAGEHLLTQLKPRVYLGGTNHDLKPLTFGYSAPLENYYWDTNNKVQNGSVDYNAQTYWNYLTDYLDSNTGVGGHIDYQTAHSNTEGTPYVIDGNGNVDDRHNPFYCPTHANDSDTSKRCGNFAQHHPEDEAWSVQAVTQIKSWGSDSSATSLHPAVTKYAYKLAKTGTYGSGVFCTPAPTTGGNPPGQDDCVGDTWIPADSAGNKDTDWRDYYHGEFHGFSKVYITSPAGDLTTQTYFSTKGWKTPNSDASNYNSGHLIQETVYNGNSEAANPLRQTTNYYTGSDNVTNKNSCNGTLPVTYAPCIVMVTSTKTINYEGTSITNPNAPWTQTAYTYDDFAPTVGWQAGYHNLLKTVTSSSNAPTVTTDMTYANHDATPTGWIYYTVGVMTSKKITDASNHVWQCQDTSYDDDVTGGPNAGWPTTSKVYSDCANKASTTLTGYTGYDAIGNPVATVDPFAQANSSLYTSNGCTLATAPAYLNSAWTAGKYTTCSTYDTYKAQIATTSNALAQQGSITYDYTQGARPSQATDINGQITTTAYSYDASSGTNGKAITQIKQPAETNAYTSQSFSNSTCATTFPSGTSLPCFEMDSNTALYSSAVTRTFYDSLGRAVETLTPGPGSTQTTVAFTVYDDTQHSVYTSLPFVVAARTTWLDPNGAKDVNNTTPGGSASYLDALGRTIAVKDPIFNASGSTGISCAPLGGNATTCAVYALGTVSGDTNTYSGVTSIDANNHVSDSYTDGLGRTVYAQFYSGKNGGSLSVNELKAFQYNILGKPTSVQVTDKAPQTGQTLVTVTTTATYDDLGRLTSVVDPDRGTHTFTYDADSRQINDVSGTRTIGTNYDLLGRVGCIQDAAVTADALGACSSGTNPFVKNTYDADPTGVTWTGSTYPKGKLTQSYAVSYLPSPENAQVKTTENMQYDARGRSITARMNLTATGGTLAFPTFPQYEQKLSYNLANQLTTTQTTVGGAAGYTMSQAYDSTTGVIIGLSNTSTGNQSLAALTYNAQGLPTQLTYKASDGTTLANAAYGYDGNLRPTGATATWQSSGNTFYNEGVGYDAQGNVVSKVTTQGTVQGQPGSGGTETQNFCYDEQNRMLWAANAGTVPSAGNGTCGSSNFQSLLGSSYTSSYVYNHLGKLWTAPLNGNGANSKYLYCDSTHPHQVTNVIPIASSPVCGYTGTDAYSASYDSWGNITTRSVLGASATLSYTGLDQLVRWKQTSTGKQEWYAYDGADQRVLRRTYDGTNTKIIVYIFGEEHQYDYSGSGSTATNSGNTYYYSLAGKLLGSYDGTTTTFYLSDSLGSVVSTFSNTAGSSAILGNQMYGPYGNKRYSKGSMGTDKGFTGQYNDALSGLDYYNARYYDPVSARFVSADTVEGNFVGMDPYAYVDGNPETKNDPTGNMIPSEELWGNNGTVSPEAPAQTPEPQTTSSNWWDTPWSAVQTAGRFVATANNISNDLNLKAADFIFGVSSVVNDFKTLSDNKKSLGDQIWAGVDIVFNVGSDILLLVGVGEVIRTGEAVTKGGIAAGEFVTKEVTGQEGKNVVKAIAEGCGGLSFSFATTVATARGAQAIGTLTPGQQVWAYNPETKKMELQPIKHVWINHDDDLIDLTITTPEHTDHGKHIEQQTEVIHTNKKHPFLTQEAGFLPVGEIVVGMHVLRSDGGIGEVSRWEVVPGTETMYNLEVEQDHTFVVGEGQWIVHNAKCGDVGSYENMVKAGIEGDGLTPHHMPQGSLAKYFGFEYEKGGTIVMDHSTHRLTFNYGGRANGVKARVIRDALTFRQALAEAIWDYRNLVPNSNGSIRELIEYWRNTYPGLMQK